jgi:hypothetical protein
MPSTRKDYTKYFDGSLASLPEATRLIYLLALRNKAHKDNRYCLKDQFFHSVKWFADESGYTERTVINAFNDLKKLKILDWQERPGRSTLYTVKVFIPPHKNDFRFTPPLNQIHPTPESDSPITTRDLTNIDLTTTQINVKKYNDMVQEFGKETVDVVVESIRNRNGKIRNPTGQMIHALRNGYNLKTPEMIQKEMLAERKTRIELENEKQRQELEIQHEESDKCDREYANKTITAFFETHKDL